ncbi:hypothetical protein ACJ41O_005420 [Fusarium nematophilum]
MPSTDALQPPLTPAERKIRNAYGGWTNFMLSMGLKPYDLDDIDEAYSIISAIAREDEEAASAGAGGQNATEGGSQGDQGKGKGK